MPVHARHYDLSKHLKGYRNAYSQIKEVLEAKNENLVLDKFDFYVLKIRNSFKYFTKLFSETKALYWTYHLLKEEVQDLEKTREMYYNENKKRMLAKGKQHEEAYFSPEEEKKVREEVRRKQAGLYHLKKKVDKMEQEYLIKQEELEIAIRDTNLARSSYYRLTEKEMELFEEQRPLILEGIEKYGSINLAIKNNAKITMRASSIMHYAQKHKQFGEDIEIAKKVFKDSIDATMIDRAINGTVNPVFQRGEYIGDYAVKDNKLLVELAKAKVPEQYNPRMYTAMNPQSVGGTTINIVSFDGVDETKRGYARNIGVVKSVDDSGRVERITQSKKLMDFYKNKKENISPDTPESESVPVGFINSETTPEAINDILEAEVIIPTPNEEERA